MRTRLLAWVAAVAVSSGCGGADDDTKPAVGGVEPTATEAMAGTAQRVIRLAEQEPQTAQTPLALTPRENPQRSDVWTARDAGRVTDDQGRPCWLYSTSASAGYEGDGSHPALTRDGEDVPAGTTASGSHFVYARPRERVVVSSKAAQKGSGGEEAASWSGSTGDSFLLPAGSTRLELRATVEPPEAPPLEIELWVDGAQVAMEFLEVGVMVDTTVELQGGRHRFELRCPRMQTAPWAHLVRPIELELDIEPSRGMLLLYGEEPEPPGQLRLRYGGDLGGSSAVTVWAAGLEAAGTSPLHRRLERGRCAHDVVLAPTPTTLTYTIDVPPRARFAVGLGGLADVPASPSLVGEIVVDAGHGPRQIWSGGAGDGDRCDADLESLSLAEYAGRTVSLTLATRSESGVGEVAYWIEPTVFSASEAGPGVILVSIDTLRADHLGCYGYDRPTSPILDELAAQATLYRRAYTTYPTTMLSHMALLRGTHPDSLSRSLAREAGADPALHPPDAAAMIQQRLQTEGWITGAFTGGGAVDAHFGFGEGFDSYCDGRSADDAGALAERAAGWLETYAGAPFFLFLHTYEVHGPYAPPAGFTERAGGARGLDAIDPYSLLGQPADPCAPLDETTRKAMIDLYDGEIRYTDEALVGRLLDTLERLELAEDTLLVVTSDHGEEFGEHGCWLHGSHLYEETVHVPLIVRYPGGRHRGEIVERPVSLVDVAPTLLAALGLDHEDMEGTPLPRSGAEGRDDQATVRGVRFDVAPGEPATLITSMAFAATERYKLVRSVDPQAGAAAELYDLRLDPGEQSDRLEDGPLPAADPAQGKLQRLYEITDPIVGEPVLEFGDHGAAVPAALEKRLRELGYAR